MIARYRAPIPELPGAPPRATSQLLLSLMTDPDAQYKLQPVPVEWLTEGTGALARIMRLMGVVLGIRPVVAEMPHRMHACFRVLLQWMRSGSTELTTETKGAWLELATLMGRRAPYRVLDAWVTDEIVPKLTFLCVQQVV